MVRHGVSKHYPQIKTGLFCFQKFVHEKPPKFRHNGLLRWESIGQRWFPSQRASNVEGVSPPWRLMITYKRHRYIHLIRQIVCMRIPDNAIFRTVGLDQHGIYIHIHLELWFMLSIVVAHEHLQWKTNGGFLRSYITTCKNRAHLFQAQYSIKWSAIYVFYWNNSCVFHMNILFEVHHIFI